MSLDELQSVFVFLTDFMSALDERSQPWIPVWAAAIGAVAGALGSLIPNFILERSRLRKEGRAIKASLVAEISSLVRIIERRAYIPEFEACLAELKTTTESDERHFMIDVPVHYN